MEQYKTTDKIQLYEMDYIDNLQLQTACNIKQPIVFEFRPIFSEFFYRQSPKIYLEQMSLVDVSLKDTDEYWKQDHNRGGVDSVDYIIISYKSLNSLIRSDARGHYISEYNIDFVEDANLGELYQRLDKYLKPTYSCHTGYDIMFGSKNTIIPMRYHTHDRIFLCVLSGKISVKMTTWKSRANFEGGVGKIIRDYENYEFWVRENPWKSSPGFQTQYLDFVVLAGQIVYIPAYWFYSIRIEESDTIISQIKYNSPINILANIRDIGKWYLQQKNIETVATVGQKVVLEEEATMSSSTTTMTTIIKTNSENSIENTTNEEISEPTLKDSLNIITKNKNQKIGE